MLTIILLAFSLTCLLLAAFSIPSGRVNLGWLGVAFYVASTVRWF